MEPAPQKKTIRKPLTSSRARATREKLRDSANRLFMENGFKATTVDAIAEAAGVSKAAFYLHFERKEDLLLEYAVKRVELVREMMPELLGAASFQTAVEKVVDATIRGKSWDREVTRLAILEMTASRDHRADAELPDLLCPLFELAQTRGEIRTDVPALTQAQFLCRAVTGALRDWGMADDELGRDQRMDHTLALVFQAVAVPGKTDA